MIKLKTINIHGEIKEWKFDSTKEILKDWYVDGMDLPSGDDKVAGKSFELDGKKIPANYFEDIINTLQIIYWQDI